MHQVGISLHDSTVTPLATEDIFRCHVTWVMVFVCTGICVNACDSLLAAKSLWVGTLI